MCNEKELCEYCDGKGEVSVSYCVIRKHKISECNKFIKIKNRYEKGVLPYRGGEMDQRWRLMANFDISDQYLGAWERLWPEE